MTTAAALRYGVIGNPIAHSQSPFIHHAFARQTGIVLSYDRIHAPLDAFAASAGAFFQAGGQGLNVTLPFKEEAWRLAQARLSMTARIAGAVNTLWMHKDALHGCNTDGAGLVTDLQRLGADPSGRRVLMLGAGGAARGAAPALLAAGCSQLHIANRTAQRATQLCADLLAHLPNKDNELSAGGLSSLDGQWDIIINATSGSLDGTSVLPQALDLSRAILAYDMVYGAQPTAFMAQAGSQGCRQCADGLGMLVGQAAASFAIWHGITPDVAPVLTELRERLRHTP